MTKLATRMAQYGRLQEFQPENEKISAYLERVDLFFDAYDVADPKKVSILLNNIGVKTYGLLRSLTAPRAPKEKTLAELTTLLQSHYEPTPIVIAERYRFHRRDQTAEESVADYVAELRRQAMHCKFEDTTDFLEESLRDRFVCGLRAESTRKRLLTEDKLTFKKAVELAQSLETATKDAQQLKEPEKFGTVHRIVSPPGRKECYRCGRTNHSAGECKFKETTCFNCGKRGHIKKVCRSASKPLDGGPKATRQPKRRDFRTRTKYVHREESEGTGNDDLEIYSIGKPSTQPIQVELRVNGKPLMMEMDTGAAVSLISKRKLREVLPKLKIRKSKVVLRTYTAESIPVEGEIQVTVQYGEQSKNLTLYVTKGDGPCLLGREWLRSIRLDWKVIGLTLVDKSQSKLDALLKKYIEIFNDELGTMTEFKAKLQMREDATPKFCRPRPMSFALKQSVEQELARMEEKGILIKVSHSEWATPIVPVPKKDGRVRVCGDYKITVNQGLDVDQHPLPKPDDLFATLAGGKFFTKLDLSAAYQQMLLEEESKCYLTINTHLGLFQFTRLPFGVASAPAIFQRAMDMILQGVQGVICYIDDILIAGSTSEEHLQKLEEVLQRLKAHGVRLKKEKCAFMRNSVEYLGHVVNAEGRCTLPSKVEAIVQAPQPENAQQLRSFLGLLNYYSKFVPNLASTLHPLNQLLQQDVKWRWTKECANAFEKAKEGLVSSKVLSHYNTDLPLKMAADASAYGVGAVISHVFPDGSERPIAFASRTLSKSEKNYAQIEKEALGLVYGVRHFHQYLYGRSFTLVTDHKPLVTILGPKSGIPSLAAARLQRWAITLSAYQYQIEFKRTHDHANADGLSRLPLPVTQSIEPTDAEVFTVAQVDSLPVTSAQLGLATRRDPLLSKVWLYTKSGWPQQIPECLEPYRRRRHELSLQGDCLLWGMRVVVPKRHQEKVLQELHSGHQGIAKMKSVARSYDRWPGLDRSLESMVKNCQPCQQVQSTPAVAPLHPWVWPSKPWQRLHIDFAGPVKGKMFLVVVDAHSKWPEVIEMATTTASKTIEELRKLFATYGLPEQVVSDNGPQFTSEEFIDFMKKNHIKSIRSTPYHPSTNGLVERFVQTLKRALRTSEASGRSVQHRLANFLMSYRSSPHTTTNRTPCELFLKREIRTRLDLLRPDSAVEVREKQASQKKHHDRRARPCEYGVGDSVMARNYRDGPKWMTGVVIERKGPLSYIIQMESGMLWRRHVDQLRDGVTAIIPESDTDIPVGPDTDTPCFSETRSPSQVEGINDTAETTERRYPSRSRHPPVRYSGDSN